MSTEESQIKIYHNPRCSKSRQTMELLQSNHVEPDVVEYLKTPPSAAELENILSLLQLEPRELMRKKEKIYKELKLDDPAIDRKTLIGIMVENPILIERPIVIHGNRAAIGRPPEKILEIL